MAGNRQHHVWQMLQRGFSEKAHGDHHVWVYKKGIDPERTVTRKFGVEKHFYGSSGSLADTNITDFENSMQGFVNEVRLMENDRNLDSDVVSSLIAHLEMRSLYIRQEMSKLGDHILRFIQEKLKSKRNLNRLFATYMKSHPEVFDSEMEKLAIPADMQSAVREMFLLNFSSIIERLSDGASAAFDGLHNMLSEQMPEIVKNAHIKSLEDDFSEMKRRELHRSMQFRTLRFEGDG